MLSITKSFFGASCSLAIKVCICCRSDLAVCTIVVTYQSERVMRAGAL